MLDIQVNPFVVIAAIAALVEAIKIATGDSFKDYLPLLSGLIGMIFAFGFLYNGEIFSTITIGLVAGFSAVGLYENADKFKKTFDSIRQKSKK